MEKENGDISIFIETMQDGGFLSFFFQKKSGLDQSQKVLVLSSHFFPFVPWVKHNKSLLSPSECKRNAGFRQHFAGFYHFLKRKKENLNVSVLTACL